MGREDQPRGPAISVSYPVSDLWPRNLAVCCYNTHKDDVMWISGQLSHVAPATNFWVNFSIKIGLGTYANFPGELQCNTFATDFFHCKR